MDRMTVKRKYKEVSDSELCILLIVLRIVAVGLIGCFAIGLALVMV